MTILVTDIKPAGKDKKRPISVKVDEVVNKPKQFHRCGVSVRINRGQVELSRDDHISLWFSADEWKRFLTAVKDGEFELVYLDKFVK